MHVCRENSFNAIKSYTNLFIAIQIYKFPSLPLIYNFCSLVCHCRYFFVDSSCTPLKLCHGGVQVVSSSNQRSAGASDGERCQLTWKKDSFVADAMLELDTDDASRKPTNSPFLARRSAAR